MREKRHGLHVLLAEDNVVNQRLATRLLEKQGHTVVVANTGKEAVDLSAQEGFDIVLMDVQMEEMDGLEATAAIRAREGDSGAHIPIVAMTAYALQGDRERCLAAGMDGYVPKPIDAEKLFEVIDELLPAEGLAEPVGPAPAAGIATDSSARPDGGARATPIDREEMMACVGGDEELFRELVELFVSDYPGHLGRIREAVNDGDADGLERAAHTLKGAVGNFAAKTVFQTALDLENMGRNGEFEGALERCAALEDEIVSLCIDLKSV